MHFDRQSDPSPLPARIAVSRGKLFVSIPIYIVSASGIFTCTFIMGGVGTIAGAATAIATIISTWLWWSLIIPKWRSWALARGSDADELQKLAVKARLVWPRGHCFERTEIRRDGR